MKDEKVVSPTRETWTKTIRKGHKGKLCKLILEQGTPGKKVCLHFNNENGTWGWAVCSEEDKGLWLNFLKTYEDALRFCACMELEVTGASADAGWTDPMSEECHDYPYCPHCGTVNDMAKGKVVCRACTRSFDSFEIPSGVVYYTKK